MIPLLTQMMEVLRHHRNNAMLTLTLTGAGLAGLADKIWRADQESRKALPNSLRPDLTFMT
jgi:hypothetical protein